MNYFRQIILSLFVLVAAANLQAQNAEIKGVITDSYGAPAGFVNVLVQKLNIGTITKENGSYSLMIPANTDVEITVQGLNYHPIRFKIKLEEGVVFVKNFEIQNIEGGIVNVYGEKEDETRTLISTEEIKIREAETLPNVSGGIETYLMTALGIQKNNELSSSYSVRGGNYDENLVYVNDFEIYRPFLIRSGQQEGLSFVNADMTDKLTFSSGGFQAKYGDKMSSVLDVQYRTPEKFSGSVMASLLGANLHVEGTSKAKKQEDGKEIRRFTYSTGFRYKTSKLVLSSQDTKGQYLPTFIDWQTFLTYKINKKTDIDYIVNYSKNRFDFLPDTRTTDFGLINFQTRFTVYYEGGEHDRYQSFMNGIRLTNKPTDKLSFKYLFGYYTMQEDERFDLIGDYYLGEVETDPASENKGEIKYELGSGTFHDWARNKLNTQVYQAAWLGEYKTKKHEILFGAKYKHEVINDKLSEWERRDSSGYSLPNSSESLELYEVLKPAPFNLNSNRYSAYIQDTWRPLVSDRFQWNYGIRMQYWDVNKEWLFSPRMQLSFKPKLKKDIVFTAASGLYYQPPFYREMRDLDGVVNTNLKAQKSLHTILGLNYSFKAWKRPFKFTTEGYYKYMWDGVPYEFDNMFIRYFGTNNSKGYVAGVDLRLHGELAKGAESWVTLSIMKGEEDIRDDFYYSYDVQKTKEDNNGQTQTETLDTLSVNAVFPGYIPRPTDQRVSFAVFFQDYIPKFPYIKVHMNLLFASGMPFGPPDHNRYKDIYRVPSYKRFDIGFSASLFDKELKEKAGKIPKKAMQHINKIWLSFEVYNLFGINNTVSYIWVDGLDPRTGTFGQYAVPNYLTQRRLNVRFKVDF